MASTRYPFLSDEWVEAARAIRAEYHGRTPPPPVAVRMNQVIDGVPFGEGRIVAHLDTSSGELEIETGLLDDPDVTITLSYEVAKAILIDGDSQAAMQAFLGGRIKVDGDISKMLALQAGTTPGGADPAALEVHRRLQDITA